MFINNMQCVCKCMFPAVGSLTAFNCFKQWVAYNLGSNSFKVSLLHRSITPPASKHKPFVCFSDIFNLYII